VNAGLIAQLVAQEQAGGGDIATLRAIVEEAGELGASRALTRLGLGDEAAHGDMAELRELLRAWRDAKRSALRGVIGWVVRMALALVLVGVAVKTGFGAWVR
jgi:hypothetical protein